MLKRALVALLNFFVWTLSSSSGKKCLITFEEYSTWASVTVNKVIVYSNKDGVTVTPKGIRFGAGSNVEIKNGRVVNIRNADVDTPMVVVENGKAIFPT